MVASLQNPAATRMGTQPSGEPQGCGLCHRWDPCCGLSGWLL